MSGLDLAVLLLWEELGAGEEEVVHRVFAGTARAELEGVLPAVGVGERGVGRGQAGGLEGHVRGARSQEATDDLALATAQARGHDPVLVLVLTLTLVEVTIRLPIGGQMLTLPFVVEIKVNVIRVGLVPGGGGLADTLHPDLGKGESLGEGGGGQTGLV